MKRTWMFGMWMLAVAGGMPTALAETAASGVAATPANAVVAPPAEKKKFTAEEYYKFGQATWANGEVMESVLMFRMAADLGHEQAMIELANLYESSLLMVEAYIYYSKAATLGNTSAMVKMAQLLSSSHNPALDLSPEESQKLLRYAAEKGDRTAIVFLAAAYARGGFGLSKEQRNSSEGLVWIQRAADMEDVFATEVLAKAYRVGLFKLTVDLVEADKWDAKLAELKNRGKPAKVEKKVSTKKRR